MDGMSTNAYQAAGWRQAEYESRKNATEILVAKVAVADHHKGTGAQALMRLEPVQEGTPELKPPLPFTPRVSHSRFEAFAINCGVVRVFFGRDCNKILPCEAPFTEGFHNDFG